MGSIIGAWKVAAQRAGIPVDDYLAKVDGGQKFCYACGVWHERSAFNVDASRRDGLAALCRDSRGRQSRTRYQPRQGSRFGPPPQSPRDGDKMQARHRVNVLVRTGRLANPNTMPCVDCGHVGADRRHEYDHHLGYAAEHHLDVQAVCYLCHAAREQARGVHAAGQKKRAARHYGLTLEEYDERIAIGLKRCGSCGAWKDRTEFNVDRRRPDGLDHRCRPCSRQRWESSSARRKRLGHVVQTPELDGRQWMEFPQ